MSLRKVLVSLFYLVFSFFFIIIAAISVLAPNYYPDPFLGLTSPVRGVGMIVGAVIFIGFIVMLYQLLLGASLKITNIVNCLLALWIIAVQIFFAVTILADSFVDGSHIKAEALHMLKTGTTSTTDYFQIYPNNIAITIIQYVVYRISSMVGIENTYIPEHILLFFLMNIMIYFSWKIAVHLFNKQMGAITLFLSATFIPYFMYLLYFYTDTAIICFVPIILYLYYKYEEKHSFWMVGVLALLLGIGYQIRPNIIILLPALVIYMVFTLSWKRTAINMLCMLLIIYAVSLGSNHLYLQMGFTPDDTKKMPNTHWIMLGLSPYGAFNSEDYKFTSSYPTYEEKQEATKEEIVNRVKNYGIEGLIKLSAIKLGSGWGSATRAYSHYLGRSQDYPIWYNYLMGDQKQLITFFAQVWHVANVALIIAAALMERKKKIRQSLLLAVCLFGVLLFHLIWEVQARYIFMYTPVMILLSLYGIQGISDYIRKSSRIHFKEVVVVASILSLLTVGIGIVKYPSYTSNEQPFYHYVAKQEVIMRRKATVDTNHQVSQTFQSQISFNFVEISIAKISANTVFTFQLIDEDSNSILYSEDFSVDEDQQKVKKVFRFSEIEPDDNTNYRIQISRSEMGADGALLLDKKSKGKYDDVDVYARGELMINNQPMNNEDLTFIVADYSERTNVPKAVYISIIFIILAVIWSTVWIDKRISAGFKN